MNSKLEKNVTINWEEIIFLIANTLIAFNVFSLILELFAQLNMNTTNSPGEFVGTVGIGVLLLIILGILKYLTLPLAVIGILKFSKNEDILDLIYSKIWNYRIIITILFSALIFDIIIIGTKLLIISSLNLTYDIGIDLFLGGLTGSYLVLFLFGFIFKRLKGFSLLKNR